MSNFNTKLIELLELIAGSIEARPNKRVIQLFEELKQINSQKIEKHQLNSLHDHDKELVTKVLEEVRELGLKYNIEDLNGVFISYKALQEIQNEVEDE